jgi:integrase
VPNPKGGAKRAFDLPLSRPLLDLLRHRIRENRKITRANTWVFPSPSSKTGRVAEVKEPLLGGLIGHALRHAYSSLALEAGVPVAELKFLLNHKVADVTFGYLNPRIAHLRECQEKASARILEAVGLQWVQGGWPPKAMK